MSSSRTPGNAESFGRPCRLTLSGLVAVAALAACGTEPVESGQAAGAGIGGAAGTSSGGQPATGGAAAGAGGALPGLGGTTSAGGAASGGAPPSGGASPSGGGGGVGGMNGGGAGTSAGDSSSGGAAGSGGATAGASAGGNSAGTAGANAGGTSAGTAGAGGTGAGTGGSGGGQGGGSAGDSPLPPITDYTESGPFDTTVDNNVGPNNAYTVFRPDPLGENGFVHAPIIFGPGIGQQVTVHTTMLTNFASHGFVVVGTPVLNGGPGDAGNRMSMQTGLDWIIEQNTAAGIYQGKLAVDKAISMGFSVGGTSAVEIGGDEAVATVVSIHGHTATAALHGPMLQTTGTQDTVGMPLQQATYDMSQVQTFLATLTGAPHQYIESNGGGEERPAILAWMRYWIYNDTGASNYFFGDDCVLCGPPWENPQRKNWQ